MKLDKCETVVTTESETEVTLDKDLLNITPKINKVKQIIYDNDNIVIGVAAPYGGGKTFFAKYLREELKKEKVVKELYINLWKNDYKDPLITLIHELCGLIEHDNEKQKRDLIKNTTKVICSLASMVSIAGVKLDINPKKIKSLLKGKDKEEITSLKEDLTKLAKDKKIVILVDEIDRCRPEFAIEFLERIKHFFDITNIVFVLFINDSYLDSLKNNYVNHYGTCPNFINKFISEVIHLTYTRYLALSVEDRVSTQFNSSGFLNLIKDENNHLPNPNENINSLIRIGELDSKQDILNQTCEYFKLTPKDIQLIMRNKISPFINKLAQGLKEATEFRNKSRIKVDIIDGKDVVTGGFVTVENNQIYLLKAPYQNMYFVFLMYVLQLYEKELFYKIKRGDSASLGTLIEKLKKADINASDLESMLEYMTNKEHKSLSSNKDCYLALTDLL